MNQQLGKNQSSPLYCWFESKGHVVRAEAASVCIQGDTFSSISSTICSPWKLVPECQRSSSSFWRVQRRHMVSFRTRLEWQAKRGERNQQHAPFEWKCVQLLDWGICFASAARFPKRMCKGASFLILYVTCNKPLLFSSQPSPPHPGYITNSLEICYFIQDPFAVPTTI